MSLPPRTLNTTLGIASIVLWSTTVAMGRSLSEQLGPITSACLIYLIGGILGCGGLILVRGTRPAPGSLNLRYVLGCGSLFALYMLCLYGALGLARDHRQVLEVGLLNYLWPMLTLLLSVPILGQRATILLIPGVLVGTAGVFLTMTHSQGLLWQEPRQAIGNGLPYLLGASAAVSWALYSTLSRRWAGSSALRGGAVPLFMLGTGLLLALVRLAFPERQQWSARAVLELLFMAISSNLAYAFWERAMRGGDLVLVAAASYLTPLLSMIVSTLYLRIVPGPRLWLGCALIVAGAVTCKLAIKAPPSEMARTPARTDL